MYYKIGTKLESCSERPSQPFVAVLNVGQWLEQKDSFDLGIDLEMNLSEIYGTKVEVNYDSLTGTFSLPNREDLAGPYRKFAFALDEKGIIFIDESGFAEHAIDSISRTKRWRSPSIERFLYDFLEYIVHDDLRMMESLELELDSIEKNISEQTDMTRVNEIRTDSRDFRVHYAQLLDLSQELEENENGFFAPENLRYFHMFSNRIDRLYNNASYLRDYTEQLGDMYHLQLEAKQNRTISVLTVVSTIFMPLTLITGWFGMNFEYMPELDNPWAYPIVIAVSVLIIVLSLIFFKKKNML